MADTIDRLFGSTSLTPPGRRPAPPPAAPLANEAALGVVLLTGILSDLAALKEFVAGQGVVNASFRQFAADILQTATEIVDGNRHQVEVNGHHADAARAQEKCNAEVLKLFERHNVLCDHVNKLAAIIGEFDDRLHALDGKRSIEIVPAPAANDPEAPANG